MSADEQRGAPSDPTARNQTGPGGSDDEIDDQLLMEQLVRVAKEAAASQKRSTRDVLADMRAAIGKKPRSAADNAGERLGLAELCGWERSHRQWGQYA
jgi:hypothetical protein